MLSDFELEGFSLLSVIVCEAVGQFDAHFLIS